MSEISNEQMIVSRTGDPKWFPVPAQVIIPADSRRSTPEFYRTGGLNFYKREAASVGTQERRDYFLFSISMEDALRLPEEVTSNFNFPPSKARPEGILQTA